ncbi:MAG: Ig-like domain-containing protein [Treponema sp.]|jgi:hypothetical protein|nr:Ig-like domain-containing protein [Treponema sp.]
MWFLNKTAALIIPAAVLLSCGFADLRPVGYGYFPSEAETVLKEPYSPVSVYFDTEMEENESSGILKVHYTGGNIEGDLHWENNSLIFIPLSPWTPGRRYTLSVSGTVYTKDKRDIRLDNHIPFYALSRSPSPVVEASYPEDGASVGISPEEGRVELKFSTPMDRPSTERDFTVSAFSGKEFEWKDDDRILVIRSKKNLEAWKVYQWSMGTGAENREGLPLARKVSGQFTTDLDRLRPSVLECYPLLFSGGSWFPTGEKLEDGLRPGLAIAICFSKPMDENFLNQIRFEPGLSGRTERLSPSSLVYIPDRDPEPESFYVLTVSAEARDTAGLEMEADFSLGFKTAIPYLRIHSFSANGGPEISFSPGQTLTVNVDPALDGVLRYNIRFLYPFSEEAMRDAPLRISLSSFFPADLDLTPPRLRFVDWFSPDTLRMEWEGLIPGTAGEKHYYRLLVPGGRSGIGNGSGIYFRDDAAIMLEAVE